MKDGTRYFADTYALIEFTRGSATYQPYFGVTIVTAKCNLAELYYYFLRTGDRELGETCLTLLSTTLLPLTLSAIRIAMRLKFSRRHDRLSYADCLGYAIAREQKIPFLTGDVKFKNLPGVAFVQ